jgi:4-hydroxythreonine-4-phosphate dehydrogenase
VNAPWVAVSMGDPAGIGPEVTLRALGRPGLRAALRPILVGDLGVFEHASERLGLRVRLVPWSPPAALPRQGVPVLVVSELRRDERRPGRSIPSGGRAAHQAILAATRLVQEGFARALVTAPISKANLAAAGIRVPGHTELLAALTRSKAVRMMMVGGEMRVALATTHLALAAVPGALSRRLVRDTIGVADGALRAHFGIRRPRIGVAGLNPHAGEDGLFGDEEKRIIAPAVRDAMRRDIDARGPLAADSLFPLAVEGRFDALVCMYHDQGLAPFKALHFADGVNYTAGLPFVRTSPDHGTALDIAGRGIADPRSMTAALQLAAKLAGRRHPA